MTNTDRKVHDISGMSYPEARRLVPVGATSTIEGSYAPKSASVIRRYYSKGQPFDTLTVTPGIVIWGRVTS